MFESWYRVEERKYDYNNPIVTDENRQFARIVSKSTQQYGCGQARDRGPGGGVYTLCIYTPEYLPGNERENIGKPLYSFDDYITFHSSTIKNQRETVFTY